LCKEWVLLPLGQGATADGLTSTTPNLRGAITYILKIGKGTHLPWITVGACPSNNGRRKKTVVDANKGEREKAQSMRAIKGGKPESA